MKLFGLMISFLLLAFAPAVCAQISGPANSIRFGPTDPPTCQAGQGLVFINTTSGLFKQCNTTDTWTAIAGAGSGDALVANPLSQFASTTSAQLAATISNETGNTLLVFNTSPVLVTPTLGAALATSINGLILTASTGTFTLTNGKTFAVTHGLTLSGTDSTVMTFPTTSATVARTDAANTFTGLQTMTTPSFTTGFTIGGAATSRKIIVGNGTNFVASTETYAVPGTSGNVLTSDGTNWTSAAPAGGGLTVGTTTIASGTTTKVLFDNAGALGEYTITGTGNVVMSASPTLTGTVGLAALTATGTIVQTSASATAFESGPNGSTNPVLRLVNSIASSASGLSITGRAAGVGVSLTALSSGTDEHILITPKGAGQVVISGTFGTSTTPALALNSAGGRGLFGAGGGIALTNGSNQPIFAPGKDTGAVAGHGLHVDRDGEVGWSSTANDATQISDTAFFRTAAGVIESTNGTAGQWGSLKVGVRDTGTTTVANGLTIGRQSTGTPAAGFGSAILFNANSSTTADQNAVQIAASASDSTHATRTYDFVVSNVLSAAALAETFRIKANGLLVVPQTITAGGTTGNRTIDRDAGTVNVAAAGTTVTVTNALVTTSSTVYVIARTADATCSVKNVVPGAGSFVLTLTAACTAETSFGFWVLN